MFETVKVAINIIYWWSPYA